MLHRIFASLAIALAGCAIGSCGNSASAPAPGGLKVGLLVTGSTSDHGWNQLAADSLQKIAAASPGTLAPQVLDHVAPDQAADNIRTLDSKGFGLVIAHGFEYQSAVQEVTDPKGKNPVKIKVAVSGGDADNPNFAALDYDLEPASYQLGIIAAKVSHSGKIGFIGGDKIPTVTVMAAGFEAGAKSVNPGISVTVAYDDGKWDDPALAKTKAESMIAQGVDIIMQNVDAASSGVFEAVKEHNAMPKDDITFPVYTFGANSDQNANPICGDFTLASAVIKLDIAFGKVIEQVKSNSFHGGLVKEDLANGVCVAVLNPKLTGSVLTPEIQKFVNDSADKLATGQIKLPPPAP